MNRLFPHLLTYFIFPASLICSCAPAETLSDPVADLGSTSLCADSYLLALAPDQIKALSWQAGTPLSTAPDTLSGLPRLWESRELIARSDLNLLTGPGGLSSNQNILSLQWGEDFAAVKSNLSAIEMTFDLDAAPLRDAIDSLSDLPKPEARPQILYLSRAGGSAGPGTFVDAVIEMAGGQNINQTPGWHTPTLERLLQYDPDLIITSFFGSDYRGANDKAVLHAALRRFMDHYPRIDIAGKLWPCAGPGLIEATRQLNTALLSL